MQSSFYQEPTKSSGLGTGYRDEALPFIMLNQTTGKFELSQESIEFMKNVPQPIGLVAVAGMYRTGKSYLLNRMLLNRSNGFGVGPSINPCTKGLWIWGRPVNGTTPDGEPLNVLIVDTEGLGALDEDSNHDVRIFSLAILLSSYFLYNSVGSIDESALQNLSLVINLTKHIHIKSRGGVDDIDTDEYSAYFPSFLWVVRDFALQLVDQEGEAIQSKDYFEKALEIQKGFSDAVEQKNRIRRLLKSFFKERDCVTMIRPLTNEDSLQNLMSMQLEDLRAEFVDQVMMLKRKVLGRIKPKMLNGKKLSGQMMSTLAQSYVTAINNGAVPNIENAWNYICKNECNKAVDDSLQKFEDILKESVLSRIPVDEDDLRENYTEAKKESLLIFQKKAVGQIAEEYVKELKLKMSSMYQHIKEENERESISQSQMFLQNSYSFIERKLKNKGFSEGFAEYEQDMKTFSQYFIENGPPGPLKRVILFEFVSRATSEAADFFIKTIQNDLDLQQTISQEHYKNLESHIKEIKQDYSKDKDLFEQKIRSAEMAKAELSAIEQSLRENTEKLMQEKKEAERDWSRKIDEQKKTLAREIEEVKSKLYLNENQLSEMQRLVYQSGSENEKEKALLEQKIEFLERNIQDYQKKESEYSAELKTQKKDFHQTTRDMQVKHDQQIKLLTQQLEETSEKFTELQQHYEETESKYLYDKQQWADSQESLKNNANISHSQFADMQKTIDELKSKNKGELERIQLELFETKEGSKQQIEELEQFVKERDEEIKNMKNRFDKEMAIYKQKLEFKDVQSQQLKTQLEETRKTNESTVRALESRFKESHDSKEQVFKQVETLKEEHTQEVRVLQVEYCEARKLMEAQIDDLNLKNNDLELKYKLLQNEYDKEIGQLSSQLEVAETHRARALEQNKNMDAVKIKMLEETEERYKQQIVLLEHEIEEREAKFNGELKELQNKAEDSLTQLKNFYEIEKERLEHRLAEEKDRASKKILQIQEEMESRLRDEQQIHEEEREMLQEELCEKERRNQIYQGQMEHENLLMQQRLETIEQQMKEKEDRYAREQSINASQLDQQFERFQQERKEMMAKIESMSVLVSSKDRELTVIKSKLEGALEDQGKQKKWIEEVKSEQQSEKSKLIEKIEQIRQKNQELNDEFIQKKLEDAREIALYKQKTEFQQKKIDDMQKQQEELISKYEERISQQKHDFQVEIQETLQRMNTTKESLDSKYEQKRRTFKEQEAQYLRQITEIQKEKAVLEEKLSNEGSRKDDIKQKLEIEIEHLRSQLMVDTDSLSKEREILLHMNEKLKMQLQEMEKELSDIQSVQERDKALWEGKFAFLEQQKELAKNDLQEASRKFEMTLEQLQKRGSVEKDKIEYSQNALLQSLEQKYKSQIKDQTESNQRMINDLNEKNKQLEKENRQLQNRLQLEQRDKMSDHGTMGKKVQELLENESKLQREIEELKQERDKKIIDNQKNVEKEREIYKQKVADIEAKAKELEHRKSSMMFEHEKEKAKWGLEKDHLSTQIQDVKEQLERMSRKQEFLLRENEKYKNEKASKRQNMYGAGGLGAAGAGGKLNPQMFGQTLLKGMASKENAISSSQAFPSGFSKYISDGSGFQSSLAEKTDPQQLPLSMKENSSTSVSGKSGLGFLGLRAEGGSSSGAMSYKSGSNQGKNESTDDN